MPSANVGEGDAGLRSRHCARQDTGADQKQAFLTEQPQPVEELLVGIGIGQGGREARRQFTLVRHRAEEARVDQPVHELRLPRQHVGKPRRGAEDEGHEGDEVAVLAEQRDQPAATLQRLQETVERRHRVVRLFGMGEACDQRRHELDEGVPRRRQPEYPVVAGHPMLHRLRHHQRLLESDRGQMLDQARIVRACAIVHGGSLAVPVGSPSNSLL